MTSVTYLQLLGQTGPLAVGLFSSVTWNKHMEGKAFSHIPLPLFNEVSFS